MAESKGDASPRSNSFSCSFRQKSCPVMGLPQRMSGKPWIHHCLILNVIQIFPNEQPMMKSVLLWNNGGRQSRVVLYFLHKRQNLLTVKIYFFQVNPFYRPKRSFGQGNIFIGVCDSVHRGGVWSRGVSDFSGGLQLFFDGGGVWSRGGVSNFFGGEVSGPGGGSLLEYGQCLAGTHPTGMHSCYPTVSLRPWSPSNTRALYHWKKK